MVHTQHNLTLPVTELYTQEEHFREYGLEDVPFLVMHKHQELQIIHYHDFYELVIVKSGSGEHWVNDRLFMLSEGDIFAIMPNQRHGYFNPQNLQLVNVLFTPEILAQLKPELSEIPGFRALFQTEPELRSVSGFRAKMKLSPEQLTSGQKILARFSNEMTTRLPGWRMALYNQFRELLLHLSRCYGKDLNAASRKMIKLDNMLNFIHRNYAQKIDRDSIMTAGGVSRSAGSRIFAEMLGQSPIEYLTRFRLRNAYRMLRETDRSVSDIAFACGFQDSNYFSSCFRKYYGVSPLHASRHPVIAEDGDLFMPSLDD